MDLNEICQTARPVALYQDPKYGHIYVGTFYADRDSQYHSGDIRISEVLPVAFTPMAHDELVRTAVAALDAAELKVLGEMQKQIDDIRERKRSILALTHQAEVTA